MNKIMERAKKLNVIFNKNKLQYRSSSVRFLGHIISKNGILKHIDFSKEITLQCDSSKDGLGCCVLQLGRPVSFSSRSLTETEINYSQLEVEMLAICFVCTKYHNWIYRREVSIETNHKPLFGIMTKEIFKIPSAKLQRMRIKLMKYNLNLSLGVTCI